MKRKSNEKINQLTRQAAEWRLISLLMSRPHGDWAEEVQALSSEIANLDLQQASIFALNDATEESYLKWMGPSGTISPREVAYIGFEDPGKSMADIMNFYHSFLYAPQAEDPDDHIAVETGFAGFLSLKEAYAYANGELDAAGITDSALRHFLQKHLCRLIRGMAEKFTGSEPAYLQSVMSYLLQAVIYIRHEQPANPANNDPDVACRIGMTEVEVPPSCDSV